GIGEAKQRLTSSAYGPYWGAGTHTAVHGRGYYAQWAPNYPYGLCPSSTTLYCQYAWGFGSYHDGCTNFVMCDGSVRSISDGLDPTVWQAITTEGGGEVVSNTP